MDEEGVLLNSYGCIFTILRPKKKGPVLNDQYRACKNRDVKNCWYPEDSFKVFVYLMF